RSWPEWEWARREAGPQRPATDCASRLVRQTAFRWQSHQVAAARIRALCLDSHRDLQRKGGRRPPARGLRQAQLLELRSHPRRRLHRRIDGGSRTLEAGRALQHHPPPHESWLTAAVRTEYAGSYMIERPFQQVLGSMKMIAGTAYMIRAALLRELGWGRSLTEDWELTLRLYAKGYKVVYTPYAETPAECV